MQKIVRKRPRTQHLQSNVDEYLNDEAAPNRQGRLDYAMTLINPFKNMGARIPDLSCFPTVTIQQTQNFSWSPTGNLAANQQGLFINFASQPSWSFINGDAVATYGLTKDGLASTGVKFSDPALLAKVSQVRLVSAGVRISWAGNEANNQGQIIAVPLPRTLSYQRTDWKTTFATDNEALNDMPGAYMGPMSAGLVYRYQPQDSLNFQMVDTMQTSPTLWGQVGFGGVYIQTSGAGAGPVFLVEIVGNYEGIPASNSSLVRATSPADPVSQAFGMSTASSLSNVFSRTNEKQQIEAPVRKILQSAM